MVKSLSHFLFGTLRGRLIISVALVHAIMMSLFIVDLTTRQHDMLLDRQTEEATALSQALATSSAGWIAADDVAGLQELVNAQSLYPEIIFVFIADKEGRVLASTDKPRQGQFMLDLPHEARLTIVSRSSSLVDVAVPAMIAGQHVGWARVGIGQKSANTKLAEIVRNGVFYALAAIFIGSVIAWFMGSQITRRLYAIQDTIASVRSGNRLARSALAGNDEAAVMAHEFNSMLDNLAKRDAELRESETKLQTIFARSLDAIGASKEGIHIFVNPAYVTIFGYENVDELIGTPIINLIAPESREMVIKNVQARTQGLPAPSDYEVIALRKDGSTFIMDVRVSTYILQDEQYTLVILRDITERKRAEEALRDSELKYRSLIEASSDAIFCVDDKGQYQFTNQLFASTFGKSPEYFIGKSFWDIYPKEHADYRFEATKRVFQTGESESLEVEVPLPDKTLFFYATANPIKDETGKVLLVLTHAVNITNLKNAEAALRKSEKRFKALADTSPLAIYASVGIEQKGTYINPTFVKLFGYIQEEVPSAKQWWPLAYPNENYRRQIENEWQRRVAQAIETHSEIEPMEVVVNCKDGSQKNILWGFETLEEENWSFGLDLTERKQAELALQKSEDLYRRAIDSAGAVPYVIRHEAHTFTYTFVGEKILQMTGYSASELTSDIWNSLIQEGFPRGKLAHLTYEEANRLTNEDTSLLWECDFRICTRDGQMRWIADTSVKGFDEKEHCLIAIGIYQDITERKRAEIALRESRDLLSKAFNDSPLMKSLSDLSTEKYLEVNGSFCRVSEFSREEVIGKTAIELGWISKDERMRFMQKVLQDGSVNGIELPLRSKKGKTIIARYWGTIIHTAQGVRLYSAAEDITERKQVEEALAASREMLDNILDNTRIHLWAFDGTHYIYTNKEWFNYTGQDPNLSLTIERWISAVHPDDVAPSGETWMKNWETKTEHDNYFRLKRYDGIYRDFYCHAVPIFNDKDDFQYFQGFNIDITERKQAEDALRESSQFNEQVIRSAKEGIIVYGPDLRYQVWNPFMEEYSGLKSSEVLGKHPLELFPFLKESGIIERLEMALAGEEPATIDTSFQVPSTGRSGWGSDTNTPLRNTKGEIVGVIGMVHDITERKRAETITAARLRILQFSPTHSLADTLQNLLDECEAQTSSSISFFHFMEADQITLSLQNWSTRTLNEFCTAEGTGQHYPLNQAGVWADCARERRAIICNDYAGEPNRKGMPDGHAKVKRFVSIPILRGENIVAIIGVGNKADDYDERDVEIVTQLADLIWDIAERKRAEEALRKSEDRFRRLANNAPDIIFRYDFVPEMQLAFISPAVEKITLYTPEECYADPLLMINMAHPDDAMLMAEYLQSRQPPNAPLNMRWLDKHGVLHWMESRLVPIYDKANQLVAVEGITRDITERKQAELQIEEQIKRLKALHTIDTFIKSSFDLKNTLKVLLAQVAAQLKVDAASILLFNKDTLTLNYSAGYGFRSTAIQHTKLKLGQGFAGNILLDREIIRIPDLTKTESELSKALALTGENFISYIGVPLIAKGEAVGVLEIFQRAKPSPNPDWFEFLEMLADQAAIAIDNTQLFENLKHSNLELIFAYNATIEGWSRAMDLRDKETEGHTQRVSTLTVQLAQQMGIPETDIVHIRRGALLHDIGKMGVSDAILRKPSQLTDEEWKEMRLHPAYAYEMLSPISYLKPALDIPYCHHEKWNGTGYPRGLKGEQIPLAARIFAIADVYDAITNDRPYREAWNKEKAIEYICEQSGSHFDPQIVEKFLELKEK